MFIEMVMMAAFLAGVIVGELLDQNAAAREAVDLAEAERFIADLRAAAEYGVVIVDALQVA